MGRRLLWPSALVVGAVLGSASPARAGDSVVHDVDGFVLRTKEISPTPCVLTRGSAGTSGHTAFGDCDPAPPKMWLRDEPDPIAAWLVSRMNPWTPTPDLVTALHFRSGTRTAFVVYALTTPPRPRFGFDPKPLLDRAWSSFRASFPPREPVGPTPAAVEGLIDGVDAYQLEGEHTVAGKVQHTSMTVVPSATHAYLIVSAGPPSDGVAKERAAVIGAVHVKAPPSSWALDLGVGYRYIGVALVFFAGLFLRWKTGISPFGWLRRSR